MTQGDASTGRASNAAGHAAKERRATSTVLAVLAAMVPGLVALGLCLAAAILVTVNDDGRGLEAVLPKLAVPLGVPMLVALGMALALFFAARGKRPAPWVLLLVATLPIPFGSGLVVHGAAVDVPEDIGSSYELRSTIGDLLMARSLSCLLGAVLLVLMGTGMCVASLARRAPGRRVGIGCGLGLLAVLPIVAFVAYRVIPAVLDDPEPSVFFPVPVALVALLAVPLAIAGIGRDADGRSVAFAVCGAVSIFVAMSAIGTSLWLMTAAETLRRSGSGGWRDMAETAAGVGTLRTRALLLALPALVPIVVAGWWGRRCRRGGLEGSTVRALGKTAQLAPALIVLSLVGFDAIAGSVAEALAEGARPSAVMALPSSFEAASPGRPGRAARTPLVVGVDETYVVNGPRVPASALASTTGRAPLVAALRANLGPVVQGVVEREVDVTIDRRVGAPVLRGLVATVTEATGSALYFSHSSPPPEDTTSTVSRGLPLARVLMQPRWEGVTAPIFAEIRADTIDDQPGWQAVVQPGRIHVAPRAGSPVLPFDLFPEQWSAGGVAPASPPQLLIANRRRPVVRLTIGDGATGALLVSTVRWLDELGADAALTPDAR